MFFTAPRCVASRCGRGEAPCTTSLTGVIGETLRPLCCYEVHRHLEESEEASCYRRDCGRDPPGQELLLDGVSVKCGKDDTRREAGACGGAEPRSPRQPRLVDPEIALCPAERPPERVTQPRRHRLTAEIQPPSGPKNAGRLSQRPLETP